MTPSAASDRVWTVPNLLSLARLVLSVVVFVLIEQDRSKQGIQCHVATPGNDWGCKLKSH